MSSEKPPKLDDRWWWLKMLVASAALAALLLGLCFGAPLAQIHYHAWKYRSGRDDWDRSFERVANWAVSRRMTRDQVVGLLGPPNGSEDGLLLYFNPTVSKWLPSPPYPSDAARIRVSLWKGPPRKCAIITDSQGLATMQIGPIDLKCGAISLEGGRAAAVSRVPCDVQPEAKP